MAIGFSDGTQAEDWPSFYIDGSEKTDDREAQGYSRTVVHSLQRIRSEGDNSDKPDSLVPGMVPNPTERGWVPYAQNDMVQEVSQKKKYHGDPNTMRPEMLDQVQGALEGMSPAQLQEALAAAKQKKQSGAQKLIQFAIDNKTYVEGKGLPQSDPLTAMWNELTNRTEGFEAPQKFGSTNSHVPYVGPEVDQDAGEGWDYPKFKTQKERDLFLGGAYDWEEGGKLKEQNKNI